MIKFLNYSKKKPYKLFKEKYDAAIDANQKNIEAICVSSFSNISDEVDARFVNLKLVDNEDFIFFTNYKSQKAIQFDSHSQVAISIYWNNINTQIRIKAKIEKTSLEYNANYFKERSPEKNALAISSRQSQLIDSYETVLLNYNNSFNQDDLTSCPDYWGGYRCIPYYFEYWEGHESRLNKRNVYQINNGEWSQSTLQP